MRSVLLPLFSLVALLCSLPQLVPALTEVSFQAHSYNDLRQWPSLILKGATWIKIDMNYATPTFCQTASLATSRVHNGSDGCFLLNHDPLSLYRTSGYNTSDDVLDFIANLTTSPWLHSPHNVSIALCHKFDYGSVCRNTSDALNWQRLMADFYLRAQSLITRHNLSLIFVEDGSGAIDAGSPCLTPLFPGWPSTYIPNENTPAGLYRNDTPTFARMNLLNIESSSFYNVSAQHYGKFPPSPYPFLLWEPSDQPTLDNYTQHYLAGLRHLPGFRYAINIDPVQFAVYTGNATGDAWNQRREELRGRADPLHVVVTYDAMHYLVVLSSKAPDGCGDDALTLTTYKVDALLSHRGLQYTSTLPLSLPAEAQGEVETFTLIQNADDPTSTPTLLIVSTNNDTQSALVIPVPTLDSWRTLKPAFMHSYPAPSVAGPSATDAVWTSADTLLAVHVSFGENSMQLAAYTVNVTSGEGDMVASAELELGGVTGLAVALAAVPFTAQNPTCPANTVAGVLSYTLTDYSAYVAILCIGPDSLDMSPAVTVSVGSHPSLSLQYSPGADAATHVLLTLATGYCFNTEPYNKEADAGLCDHQPVPMTSTLTYTFSTLASLMRYIHTKAKNDNTSLVCSTELLHGTYDLGGRQSAKLWVGKDEDGVQRLGVMEVHEGMHTTGEAEGLVQGSSDVGLVPSTICGTAIPFDGLVVDAWPLPLRTSWESEGEVRKEAKGGQRSSAVVQVVEM